MIVVIDANKGQQYLRALNEERAFARLRAQRGEFSSWDTLRMQYVKALDFLPVFSSMHMELQDDLHRIDRLEATEKRCTPAPSYVVQSTSLE